MILKNKVYVTKIKSLYELKKTKFYIHIYLTITFEIPEKVFAEKLSVIWKFDKQLKSQIQHSIDFWH